MTFPVLEACGIGKQFGAGDLTMRALHPTELAVQEGDVVVVMGPSGSGKSTLLSILGLVLAPTEGFVRLDGKTIRGDSGETLARLRRDKLGFIFQQFNLISGLTALENVGLPLLLRGTNRHERRARAEQALAAVSMSDKLDAKARQLSVGQQQRVAIARALVADARILLCDEPTASLDAATGRSVLDTLRRLAHVEHRAVVIVTHDERVLRIADRLVNVRDGQVSERKGFHPQDKNPTHDTSE